MPQTVTIFDDLGIPVATTLIENQKYVYCFAVCQCNTEDPPDQKANKMHPNGPNGPIGLFLIGFIVNEKELK